MEILRFFLNLWFLWVPVVLGFLAWHYWIQFIHARTLAKMKWVNLEISVPRDVFKSPEAMELIFNTLHEGGGMSTWIKKYINGNLPKYFSLELVSIEGSVYFFIRTLDNFAPLIKNQVYAQFPQAEIHEVDDYTKYVGDYTNKQHLFDMFGVEFTLTGDHELPIKTYVDYGLDKAIGTLEEYQKIDPITPLLEFLGSMRNGEQVWMQMIVRSDKWSDWRKNALEKINIMMGRNLENAELANTGRLSPGEQEKIKAIERSLHKIAFEVGFRAMYFAKKDAFRPSNIPGLIGSVRQYGSMYHNGFRPQLTTDYDYPWQDPTGSRLVKLKSKFFKNFVNRAYFYDDVESDWQEDSKEPFILTAEELATIFRIPGRVSETSAVERVEAVKAEPPTNLPI